MKYYKFRNGSKGFEREVSDSLKNIEHILGNSNQGLICGVFSAVIAEYIMNLELVKNYTRSVLMFTILMCVVYILFLLCIRLYKILREVFQCIRRRKTVTDSDEMRLKEYFYDKVANEFIYCLSLVNRVEQLKATNTKVELCKMYLFQTKEGLENIAFMLDKLIFTKPKYKRDVCIDSLGKQPLRWLFSTALSYIEKMEKLDNEIDLKLIKEYYAKKI